MYRVSHEMNIDTQLHGGGHWKAINYRGSCKVKRRLNVEAITDVRKALTTVYYSYSRIPPQHKRHKILRHRQITGRHDTHRSCAQKI